MSDEPHPLDLPEFLRHPGKKSKPPSDFGGGLDKIAPTVLCGTEERWQRYETAQREDRLRKSRGRVGKMLAVRSDRAALAAGKHWDVKTGKWV